MERTLHIDSRDSEPSLGSASYVFYGHAMYLSDPQFTGLENGPDATFKGFLGG